MLIVYLCFFFREMSIQRYAHFSVEFFLCCWVVGILYIIWILTPYQIWFPYIFFSPIGCLFTLLIMSIDIQKFFILMESNLSIFTLFAFVFWCRRFRKVFTSYSGTTVVFRFLLLFQWVLSFQEFVHFIKAVNFISIMFHNILLFFF